MENLSKEKFIKIKDVIVFTLLFLWMALPIFQTLKPIYEVIDLIECYFALMQIIGVVGIATGIYMIYDKIRYSENKKQTLKELIPIFLFVIYMIWTLISCLSASSTRKAFYGTSYRREGYYRYLMYAGYFLCAFLLDSKKLRKILLNTFIIASIFLIIISRVTLSGTRYTDIFVNSKIETTIFGQFNHYCYYIMMTLMCALGLFLTEKNKVLKTLYVIAYAVIAYAMIYNDTFGCYLATIGTLILYTIYAIIKKKDRIAISIAIVIFILLSIFTTKDGRNVVAINVENFMTDISAVLAKFGISTEIGNGESTPKPEWEIRNDFMSAGTNRGELWHNAFNFILRKPIIGYGADNLGEQYENVLMYGRDRPHNLILYLACVSGIPGMLLYLTAVGIIVVKGIIKLMKDNDNGIISLLIVVAYLISSMFGNSMFYTSPFFFIFLGNLMNSNLNKKEE
ncbi:MAG: O-antigen ligase family protein [Clostridia bacterium]|nr:O-antigen ligase family protein [Clostridia bacterium]